MFKRIGILLSGASLITCAHLTRGPAAVNSPSDAQGFTCAQIFKLTFGADQLQRIFDHDAQVFEQVRKFEGSKYPVLIHEFMSRAANRPSCEDERDVDLWAADITSKIQIFNNRMKASTDQKTAQAILSKPAFANAPVANQWACFGECQVRQEQAISFPAVTCEKKCGLDPELGKFYQDSIAMRRVMDNCFAGVTDKNSLRLQADFKTQYAEIMPPFLEKLQSLQSRIREDLVIDQAMRESLLQLRAEYAKFKTARQPRKCPAQVLAWQKAAAEATVNLRYLFPGERNFGNEGSGFYFMTTSQRYLATAAHVSHLYLESEGDTTKLILSRGTQQSSVQFKTLPGLAELTRDVTLKTEAIEGPGLKLVGENELPQPGQRFYLTGFPSSGNDRFQIVRCSFLGFGPRLPEVQENATYYLRCPGAGDMHGISGGAMLDAEGRVWGVNSSSEPHASAFHATPISMNVAGEVKIGLQQTFLTDLCYSTFEAEPHRCQIMPVMLDKDIPQ
ncbi:MAG: S1 family peptidase, partial [Bdellovibrionales bacterium]